jgi:hypothetical protein
VVARHFGPAKEAWKVVEASGRNDPAEAKRWASYAIDDDLDLVWQTDIGFDAKGFPHHLVIDLGSSYDIASLRLAQRKKEHSFGQFELYVSKDLRNWSQPVAAGEIKQFQPTLMIPLQQEVAGRFIKLVAKTPLQAGSSLLTLAEVDVLTSPIPQP